MAQRSYDDQCGIARALDVIGERWALLVVRELLYGPKRFSDLQRGLGLISQNVLSDRLRELQAGDIVERFRLGPPASATAYRLTARGQELRGVLAALGRWGSGLPLAGRAAGMSADAIMFALESTFAPASAADLKVTVVLHLAPDTFVVRVRERALTIKRGSAEGADLALDLDVPTLEEAAFRGTAVGDLVTAGRMRCQGQVSLAGRFFACFPFLPTMSGRLDPDILAPLTGPSST